uniref:Ubiquitin carboxyl-terminal hydrolase 12 n=1 Tax=Fundulus heteroclitus TaxID=8078 RepID=A0A146ND89_FUNHE
MQRCQNLDLKCRNMNRVTLKRFTQKLENLAVSDYQGLRSPGLTCYLNSVLQVLFMTEEFREAVTRNDCENQTTIDPHLGELFSGLEVEMAKTHNIAKRLGIRDVYEQRDAAEYFEKILCQTSPEASKIFRGELHHKTTCLKCYQTSQSSNFFWVLPLSMGDPKSRTFCVLQGLKNFFRAQRVSEDNQIFCSRCNEKQDADTEYEMTHRPDVLTLLLKRFSFDYRRGRYVKLHCKADVAQALEVQSRRYDLYAVVHHYGDLMGGHYIAEIKSFETGSWYRFDDNTVRRVNKPCPEDATQDSSSETAYLLMYKMASGRAEKTDGSAPSDETGDGCNEAEPREGLVSEHLLKTESQRGAGGRHLTSELMGEDTFKKKRSGSIRRGSGQSNQIPAQVMLQGGPWLPADTDSMQQMSFSNRDTSSYETFHQRPVSATNGIGANVPRGRTSKNATKTVTNNHLYNRSPIRGRKESAEAPAVAAKQKNGPTNAKTWGVDNYNAKSTPLYYSTSSSTRSSPSFRTGTGSSVPNHKATAEQRSLKGKTQRV